MKPRELASLMNSVVVKALLQLHSGEWEGGIRGRGRKEGGVVCDVLGAEESKLFYHPYDGHV